MRDYRLRIYRERCAELSHLRAYLVRQRDKAVANSGNPRYVQGRVREVQEDVNSFIASREWPPEMKTLVKDLGEQLKKLLEEGDKWKSIKCIVYLAKCVKKHHGYWFEEAKLQYAQLKQAKDVVYPHVRKFDKLYGFNMEYVFEIDAHDNVLHIFVGGKGNPLGPGHGHYVIDILIRRITFERPPKEESD